MGNTIRRQPISSKIPASPNYRFLNITDFKGLDISDNPFILKPNTASDLLNVYVDENNALSTRPRLEKTHDFSWLIGDGELVGVYNITDGYLIHVNVDGVYKMYKHPVDAENNEISGDIPTDKCSVFEKNDTVYMLDGNKYYALKDMRIGFVEPYVPTTKVGATASTEGSPFEELNILTDKYKESYFWDTFEMPDIFKDDSLVSFENNTYEKTFYPTEKENNLELLTYCDREAILYDVTTKRMFIGTISKDFTSITYTQTNHFLRTTQESSIRVSRGTNVVCDLSLTTDKPHIKYELVNGELVATNISPSISNMSYTKTFYCVSTDGKAFIFGEYGDYEYYMPKLTFYSFDSGTEHSVAATTDQFNGADIIDGVVYITGGHNKIYYSQNIKAENISQYNIIEYDNTVKGVVRNPEKFKMSAYGGVFVLCWDVSLCFRVDSEGNCTHIAQTKYENSYSNAYASYPLQTQKGMVCLDATNPPTEYPPTYPMNYVLKSVTFDRKNTKKTETGVIVENAYTLGTGYQMSNHNFHYDNNTDTFFIATYDGTYKGFYVLHRKDSTEPSLYVTKKLTNDEKLENISKALLLFNKSFLVKRFENNWWFASGNTVFRTENNDPTYIPLDEEFELGDSKDPITGFNIAQDDLLLVYKKNNIYAIQPYEAYNRSTYSILETKNVSGNNATGSTIVTTLTEIPVHISYDGIFALKQLKNVQSSDRISELISDNINKRWLKESKSAIDNCQTINRLYWTYFVLKERDVTKVYLLDNRTQSWFYWELPITCINVFVKDETTIFVDENGMVYKLTTDDIINEYNKDVTEYYDNGKKLIKWFWKSQILPLGTINYSKKLVDTTFIVADTDDSDEYGLNYKFRAYRKLVSESNETTISNRLNYVQSTTKKTLIPRFNFLQLEISNVEDDLNNNKLRLLGLGLKYVLLEGLL